MRNYTNGQKFIISLIFFTTLPFFLLLTNVDWTLRGSDQQIFWIQLSSTFGSIIGFIGMSLLLWSVALGVRPLVRLFTPDLVWSMKIHTWIGKYGILLILLHPLLIMYGYLEDFLWLITPELSTNLGRHIAFGRMALILMFIIWITSALIRSRIKYRPWLYIHYLTYPIILFVFIHALDIGTYLNSIIFLKAIWFTLLVGFLVTIFYRLYVYSGLGKKEYTVTYYSRHSDANILFKVNDEKGKIKPKIGQFIYIQLGFMGESHPFTVLSYNKETGEIAFGIKVVGRFTKQMSMLKEGDKILLDGPYGVFTREVQNDTPKIIFAGGVGIAPFIDLIRDYPGNKSFLFYSVRRLDDIFEDKMLSQRLGNRYKIFLSAEKSNRKNLYNRRVDEVTVNEILRGRDLSPYKFLICGSKGYIENAYNILDSLDVNRINIYHEEYEL